MEEIKDFIVQYDGVSICHDNQEIVKPTSFEIRTGEFVFLTGPVGSGKTTLIRSLNGEVSIYTGKAKVFNYQLDCIKSSDIPYLRRKLGVVFQDFKLIMDWTVYRNLEFVLKATGWKQKNIIETRINEVLQLVGMDFEKDKYAHQLSGGEQQRIAIARALLNKPELILADEPTGNLDVRTSESIMNIFKKINANGQTIIMATHDKLMLEQFPARTLNLNKGYLSEKSIIS